MAGGEQRGRSTTTQDPSFHGVETMLEDKQAQQLYRTAALHELWARTNLSDKAHFAVS
jgi:hypothetical protein